MVKQSLSALDFAAVGIYATRDITPRGGSWKDHDMRQDISGKIGASIVYGWAINQLPPATFRGLFI